MEPTNVCRVCLGEGVLLDLFGTRSSNQKTSYAEDVNRCLAIKAEEGDGLPSKICVKCLGLISDCRPFVENIVNLEENGVDYHMSFGESCFFCVKPISDLFPLPKDSLVKTKESFNIDVPENEKICLRCQFLLEVVVDLKNKACSSEKQFYSSNPTVKQKKTPSNPEASVQDVVLTLSKKYIMVKRPESGFAGFEPEEAQMKYVRVELIDIEPYLRGLSHPVDLSKYRKNLDQAHWKRVPKTPQKASKGSKTIELLERKSRRVSVPDSTETVSKFISSSKKVDRRKRPLEVSDENESPTKRLRRGSVIEEADSSKADPTSSNVDSSRTSPTSPKADSSKPSPSPRPNSLKTSVSAGKKAKESSTIESKGYTPGRSRKLKKFDSKEDCMDTPSQSVDVSDGVGESFKESDSEKVSSSVEDHDSDRRKRKKRGSPKSYSAMLSDEDEPAPMIKRKRVTSAAKDFFSSKGLLKKKRRETMMADEDSGLDENTAGGKNYIAEQPDYLKALDELLKLTPKGAFRPFICSVCHEGYVSTVKGKLHKLVAHDPHSNITIKLMRCEDDPSWADIITNKHVSEAFTDSVENTINGDDSDDSSSCKQTGRNGSEELEDKSVELSSSSKSSDKKVAYMVEDESDDLFGKVSQPKQQIAASAFDDLFSSTTERQTEEHEKIAEAEEQKKVDAGEKDDDVLKSNEGKPMETNIEGEERQSADQKENKLENIKLNGKDKSLEEKNKRRSEGEKIADQSLTDTDEDADKLVIDVRDTQENPECKEEKENVTEDAEEKKEVNEDAKEKVCEDLEEKKEVNEDAEQNKEVSEDVAKEEANEDAKGKKDANGDAQEEEEVNEDAEEKKEVSEDVAKEEVNEDTKGKKDANGDAQEEEEVNEDAEEKKEVSEDVAKEEVNEDAKGKEDADEDAPEEKEGFEGVDEVKEITDIAEGAKIDADVLEKEKSKTEAEEVEESNEKLNDEEEGKVQNTLSDEATDTAVETLSNTENVNGSIENNNGELENTPSPICSEEGSALKGSIDSNDNSQNMSIDSECTGEGREKDVSNSSSGDLHSNNILGADASPHISSVAAEGIIEGDI